MLTHMIATAPVDAESLTELRRWLQAVDALTEAVNSTRSLAAILDLVASSARELLGFDFCAVLLPDSQHRRTWSSRAGAGCPPSTSRG